MLWIIYLYTRNQQKTNWTQFSMDIYFFVDPLIFVRFFGMDNS